jgi:hypothetical protein
MAFFSELRERVDALATHTSLDVRAGDLPAAVADLDDSELLRVLADAAAVVQSVEKLRVVIAGVAAHRSSRERGYGGLATTRGHKSPVSLVQSITGETRAEAARHVRLGTAVVDAAIDAAGSALVEGAGDVSAAPPRRWDDGLRNGLLSSRITAAQHDAIFRGLGEPPVSGDATDAGFGQRETVIEAWALAAEQLMVAATEISPDDLLARAREVRDALDPAGAEARFARRYERRSFQMWTDADGQQHARIDFDDEMAAWVRSMVDAALRPRRGGPRFVDPGEAASAAELTDDARTNDQMTYDLIMDVWRAGSLAQADDVFGKRQPGVRMVVVKDCTEKRDAFGRLLATGHLEDRGHAIPGSVIERALCGTGNVEVTVDSRGNPLDLGREQRLFATKQRLALAVRDGGCMFTGCSIPASYCEAHHCDHWWAEGGRTDIDRGILLCRHHHMLLHNNGWKITREGLGPFVLESPPRADGSREVVELRSKSPVRWAWDPPPPPDRAGWRHIA